MKKLIILLVVLTSSIAVNAQIKLKKNELVKTEKKKKFNIMEKFGDVTANLMTSKSETLDGVVLKANYVSSLYSKEIETTEAKYFPEGAQAGDQMVSLTFFKNEGTGMFEILGDITCNNEPMEYVGMGSYMTHYFIPRMKPVVVKIKTTQGDEASFTLNSTPEVEIISVNGEKSLPILDLNEDIEIEYYNPPGSEGTWIKVSMLTKVMGVKAFNHFADYKVTKSGITKVTIPKEALANPEIAGQLDAGNFDKGDNFLVLERESLLTKDDYDNSQNPGKLSASELYTRSYASFPVILKGKQEDGLLTTIKVRGQNANKTLGYSFQKPNANYGIPFSKGSKFGLVSFTMDASTYKQETTKNEHSWTVGSTKYTRTTIRTTTYDFPELPDSHWETAMEQSYQSVVNFFQNEYGIDFVPVENVTSTTQYQNLFNQPQVNNTKKVVRSYKNTKRSSPSKLAEILGSRSTNMTADNPTVNMMKDAGDIDGLVSMHLSLQIGSNEENNLVMFPQLTLSIQGRDEDRNNKQGEYINGLVTRNTGEAYNEALLKSDPNELARVCSMPVLLDVTKAAIVTMQKKEVELGYDKIWGIAEN